MNISVKICGITRPEDALYAEKLGASAIGFVFFRKSPRYIVPEKAVEISQNLGPFIARVGVFVDEDQDTIRNIIKTVRLTAVQLHGSESPEYIESLKGINIIKAFRVGPDYEYEKLRRYDVSAFLLDTYASNMYGGTGKPLDWEKAYQWRNCGRIILAGGLNVSNIHEALVTAQPWGVDVSSGVETSPGIKDPEKMRAFVKEIKKVKIPDENERHFS
ncbi:MAG TPA: phosphoribosylanthranilate isomerase [Anaerolineae bacterium]|nr:phosphoribosylanthranilate isomerase [Anaerolineae bacterium]